MALLARSFARKSGSTMDLIREALSGGGRMSSSGKNVTFRNAIQVGAVFACMRVIANGMAQVPLKLMRESKDGRTRLPAKDHELYDLLARRPNSWQTSFEWRQLVSWHVELCGDHFSFINRGSRGQVLELIPFEPQQVTVKRAADFTLTYEVRVSDGSTQIFPAEAILHVRGPSWNSWQGLDAVKYAREAIGLAMATEEAVGRLHRNGVRPSGVYSVEGSLKQDQYEALSKWIDERYASVENTGKPMILDRAAKWIDTQMSGIDAQSLETRRYQVEEVCRFFGVMPIMVGYSDKTATYASAEQMFLAHSRDCLSPRWTAYEQVFDTQLLTDKDRRDGLYFNFTEEAMARGSLKDTKDAILGYVNGGLLTPNEGRALLDRNPIDDDSADALRIPANIVGDTPDEPQDPPATAKALGDLHLAIKGELRGMEEKLATPPVAPNIDIKAGDVSVVFPEGFLQITNEGHKSDTQVDVHVPEAAPPVVHVAAPDIKVDVAAPVVTLEATLPPPTEMNMHIISMPDRQTQSTVERDGSNNIVRTTQLETDKD